MTKAGLLVACLGALLLALSAHLGGVTGFVGVVVWAGLWWRLANITGWLLLVLGLFLQYMSERRTFRVAAFSPELHALLDVLEGKGLLTHPEVMDVIANPSPLQRREA